MKKIILGLILTLIAQQTYAKDLPVNVYTPVKITTSNRLLQEGDTIEFKVAEDIYVNSKLYLTKDEKVTGVITSLEPNAFGCKEAVIYAENFKVKNTTGKMVNVNGIIEKKGRTHWMFTQILPFLPEFIRGGEAHILPKERYTLFLEDTL